MVLFACTNFENCQRLYVQEHYCFSRIKLFFFFLIITCAQVWKFPFVSHSIRTLAIFIYIPLKCFCVCPSPRALAESLSQNWFCFIKFWYLFCRVERDALKCIWSGYWCSSVCANRVNLLGVGILLNVHQAIRCLILGRLKPACGLWTLALSVVLFNGYWFAVIL